VGTNVGALPWIGPKTRVVDHAGHDIDTAEAILAKVRSGAQASAGKPWLLGGGWTLAAFPGGAPTKEALDAVLVDRPAGLDAADGHWGFRHGE
jgi:predicted amidohydrolase YtcJ